MNVTGLSRKVLREPLVHFLLLGVLLFAAHALMADGDRREAGSIFVTRAHVDSLAATFTRTRQRPPTHEELDGLIEGYVREEVLYREGVAMGLDREDPIIRRRVQQKVNLFSEDINVPAEPSEIELQGYLDKYRAQHAVDPKFSFRHVFVDPARHGGNLEGRLTRLLAELARIGDSGAADRFNDPTLLPHRIDSVPASEVTRIFGQQFASGLAELKPGQWVGPVRSGSGLHLVFVSDQPGQETADLVAVRAVARREWERDQRVAAAEKFYQQRLQRYTVTIEETKLAQSAQTSGLKIQ